MKVKNSSSYENWYIISVCIECHNFITRYSDFPSFQLWFILWIKLSKIVCLYFMLTFWKSEEYYYFTHSVTFRKIRSWAGEHIVFKLSVCIIVLMNCVRKKIGLDEILSMSWGKKLCDVIFRGFLTDGTVYLYK